MTDRNVCPPDNAVLLLHNRRRTAFIAFLVAATIWGLTDVRRRGFPYPNSPEEHKTDLTVYTLAGKAFFDGGQPYEVANPRGWTYLYPPMFAMLLAPLSVLPTQDQVTVWFFVSLALCVGCYRECRRIVEVVCDEDSRVASTWARWAPWLGAAAIGVAILPTLNCLQRGQVGVFKLYFLLLGLRWILAGRTWRAWLGGGVAIAVPVVLKVLPLLQVGFLMLMLLIDFARGWRGAPPPPNTTALKRQPIIRRFMFSTTGFGLGLTLFVLMIPAALVGWRANLHHLDTWARFVLTKADDGGMDPRSGNSHSSRNQSLHNAAYRLGNFVTHVFADGPDDRLVETFTAPKMAMDAPAVEKVLMGCQATLILALLALGLRLARGDGNRLNLAVGFAVACAAMLVVSPVARGHYFLLLAPAVLLVPLWLERHGRPRVGIVLAAIPPVFSVLHYILLPYGGRVGLLGFCTAGWLMAVMVAMARADHFARRAARAPRIAPQTSSLPMSKAA